MGVCVGVGVRVCAVRDCRTFASGFFAKLTNKMSTTNPTRVLAVSRPALVFGAASSFLTTTFGASRLPMISESVERPNATPGKVGDGGGGGLGHGGGLGVGGGGGGGVGDGAQQHVSELTE